MNVRLRSANRGNAYNVWNVNTAGNANNNNATNANRPCPDCETSGQIGAVTNGIRAGPIRKELKPLPETANNNTMTPATDEKTCPPDRLPA